MKNKNNNITEKNSRNPVTVYLLDNMCDGDDRLSLMIIKNELENFGFECLRSNESEWLELKKSNKNSGDRNYFLHVWGSDSPFGGDYLYYAKKIGIKPGKNDFFICIGNYYFMQYNRECLKRVKKEREDMFSDDARKEMNNGVPHIFVIYKHEIKRIVSYLESYLLENNK